jgi:hypothetical protein
MTSICSLCHCNPAPEKGCLFILLRSHPVWQCWSITWV